MKARGLATARLSVSGIGNRPLPVLIEAADAELAALADRLGLDAADSLSARLTVSRRPDGKLIEVSGSLYASVVQSCVVTGEPVPSAIESEVLELLVKADGMPAADVAIDPLGEDPEPIDGDEIDLGDLVVQCLSLALPAYPRHPDAGNEPIARDTAEKSPDTGDSPFAELARLRPSSAKKP